MGVLTARDGLPLECVLASGNIGTATGVLEAMSGAVSCNLARAFWHFFVFMCVEIFLLPVSWPHNLHAKGFAFALVG